VIRITALLIVLFAARGADIAAQQIAGTLVQHPGGDPIPRALVQLLDSTGAIVDSTRSGVNGAFVLRASAAGEYALYFAQPGYATVPSEALRLHAGQRIEYRFSVPLISGVALQRMAEVIQLEKRLQSDLTELCGEPLRTTEAGMLVGVVRSRTENQPIAGAIVSVAARTADGASFQRATVSSANGVYVLCNIPAGAATMRTEAAGHRLDDGPVAIRAGDVAWYDVLLRAR
jgi:hypothetical protein